MGEVRIKPWKCLFSIFNGIYFKLSVITDIGWGNKVDVNLVREPTSSFGVCIVGGKVNIQNTQISGIFIKNIIPLSPAEESRQIKIGDRILSVNGQDVSKATQDETIKLIKNAGCTINLVLQSFDNVIVSIYTVWNV